jgi:Na+/melibiose symporter-like transporter
LKKITQINIVLNEYFEHNKNVQKVPVAFMMSYFVLAGIFKNDESKGKSIQNFLRRLEEKNQLHLIPFAKVEQKNITKKWFFERAYYKPVVEEPKSKLKKSKKISFKNSDAFYVLGLCNKVLISKFEITHKEFYFNNCLNLNDLEKVSVDGFYPNLKLGIKFLDKATQIKSKSRSLFFTEKAILEDNDYLLIFISYKKFTHLASGQLVRRMQEDLEVLRTILEPYYPKTTLF